MRMELALTIPSLLERMVLFSVRDCGCGEVDGSSGGALFGLVNVRQINELLQPIPAQDQDLTRCRMMADSSNTQLMFNNARHLKCEIRTGSDLHRQPKHKPVGYARQLLRSDGRIHHPFHPAH
jgi:hypothetical protein